eukprot:80612-Prorocentrum_minimum.AAC.1
MLGVAPGSLARERPRRASGHQCGGGRGDVHHHRRARRHHPLRTRPGGPGVNPPSDGCESSPPSD